MTQRLGSPVITDFRRADLATGGQGAPLAGLYQHYLNAQLKLGSSTWINIGGITNISIISPSQSAISYDIGPGCCLIDGWYQKYHDNRTYDLDGLWASSGQCNATLLEQLKQLPFFKKASPKSACRSDFSLADIEQLSSGISAVDVQRTLVELTAHTIIDTLTQHSITQNIFLYGGGSHHPIIQEILSSQYEVKTTQHIGIDPDYFEAMLIAWLAYTHEQNEIIDTSAFTGGKPHRLGSYYTMQSPQEDCNQSHIQNAIVT